MLGGIRLNVLSPTNRNGGGIATLYLAVIQGRNSESCPVLAARKNKLSGYLPCAEFGRTITADLYFSASYPQENKE